MKKLLFLLKFLASIERQNEFALKPLPFIQSSNEKSYDSIEFPVKPKIKPQKGYEHSHETRALVNRAIALKSQKCEVKMGRFLKITQ